MVTVRKLFLITILFSTLFCSLYGQNNGFKLENPDSTEIMDENNILFSDEITTDNDQIVSTRSPSTIGLLIRVIIVLVIVIGIIYGILWFVKRKTNIVKDDDEFLRRAAYINITPGKTVEVITLIDKAYLIGVTEDNITLLGEITDTELINAMNVNADKNHNIKKPLNFTEVLDLFTTKGKNKNIFEDSANQVDNILTGNKENQ